MLPRRSSGSSDGFGPPHLEDDVGLAVDVGGASERRARGDELGVGNAGVHAGAGFHDHRVTAAGDQLLDRFGRGGHARLAGIDFGRDADAHRVEPLRRAGFNCRPGCYDRPMSLRHQLPTRKPRSR